MGDWRHSSTHSLTSALDGGEWSASRSGRFTPRERAPGTHWIGGWVGPSNTRSSVIKSRRMILGGHVGRWKCIQNFGRKSSKKETI
jgi:hypothetical protein